MAISEQELKRIESVAKLQDFNSGGAMEIILRLVEEIRRLRRKKDGK